MFGISEIAILLIVVIIVLGAKKLPELARNAGKAARILKSETRAMKSDDGQGEPQAVYEVSTPPTAASGTAAGGAAGATAPAPTASATSPTPPSPARPGMPGASPAE
ncbi:twin-arginine translocase TatA/TatE family subunit [Streptomyces sp. NBC_01216]|uniref:twin-arginine translocase TatA/TatE family subunit n=1 Tax=unclassified Streptomyces TaxID=2593676 RepID=UPI002E101563|nr:twin-arginine translocase TatA/TatE family subunit [Streptomyces sp. NBC_01216]